MVFDRGSGSVDSWMLMKRGSSILYGLLCCLRTDTVVCKCCSFTGPKRSLTIYLVDLPGILTPV